MSDVDLINEDNVKHYIIRLKVGIVCLATVFSLLPTYAKTLIGYLYDIDHFDGYV